MRLVIRQRVAIPLGLALVGISLTDLLGAWLWTSDPTFVVWLSSGLLGCLVVLWASADYRRWAIAGSLLALCGVGAPAGYARLWFVDDGRSLPLVILVFHLWHVGLAMTAMAGVLSLCSSFRATPGLCRECGYDLTLNVSGICPECGQCLPIQQLVPGRTETKPVAEPHRASKQEQ